MKNSTIKNIMIGSAVATTLVGSAIVVRRFASVVRFMESYGDAYDNEKCAHNDSEKAAYRRKYTKLKNK